MKNIPPPPDRPKTRVRLSGESAFTAAVMAGIPIETSMDASGKITLTTAYPVDVIIDNGTIKVFRDRTPK